MMNAAIECFMANPPAGEALYGSLMESVQLCMPQRRSILPATGTSVIASFRLLRKHCPARELRHEPQGRSAG
jgi:hypothetical protein